MLQSFSRARWISLVYLSYNSCVRKIKAKKLRWSKSDASEFNLLHGIAYAGFFGVFQQISCAETVAKELTSSRKREHVEAERNVAVYIVQSDEYFKVGKYNDSYKVLQYFEKTENAEVLWRMARDLYNMSKQMGVKHSEKVRMIEEGYALVRRALRLDYNNYAVHKWMAILLDAKHSLEGVAARIKALPDFKKHLLRAMELNPKDATSIYILGQYCFNIASMPWYERKIAAALFATPPNETFEEALYYFSKAEEVEPNFYSLNLLMLGKTYLQLKKIEAARYWLKCASTYPIRTEEDKQVRKEAEELLRKHPSVKFQDARETFADPNSHKNNE